MASEPPPHPWFQNGLRECLGNREMLKGHFAAVTAMGANVGRLLDWLDSTQLRKRTLVVFMSDNGFSCGHHGFWGKGNGTFPLNMYENSVKVPAIFSHPGRIQAGRVTKAMVSQYDFLPTLLDYIGLPPVEDPTLPGTSFRRVLTGEANEAREDVVVFDEYGPVRMIRTREWKYVHRYPYGPHELYDLIGDLGERVNLVDEKSRQNVVAEMRKRLAGWFERFVVPTLDGARFPVTGHGQIEKIGAEHPGETAFQPAPRGVRRAICSEHNLKIHSGISLGRKSLYPRFSRRYQDLRRARRKKVGIDPRFLNENNDGKYL